MIEQLTIKNFAIIEDLEVNFNSGFISLCGETGAGKSIIIDAIGLLLGQRSSFDKIRNGKQKAFIEGVFSVVDDTSKKVIEELLDEEILDVIVLSRSLDINGKSIAKINSRIVSISLLKSVTNILIDIHSQQKDNDYLKSDNQFNLLNNFIFNNYNQEEKEVFDSYNELFNQYSNVLNAINDLKAKKDILDQEDYLLFQKEELEKANIQPNEMENLEDEKNSLIKFSRESERILSFLNEYESISSSLYNAKKQISYVEEDSYNDLSNRFSDLYFQINDVYEEIKDNFEKNKDSLIRLEQINDRLFYLHSLRKKYGYTTNDILNKYEEILVNLDDIKNYESKLNDLSNKYQKLEFDCKKLAVKMTDIRKKYAEILTNEVNIQLNDLYLENAEFKIDFNKLDKINNFGFDSVIFMLKANKGLSFNELDKTASLGETSRFNLALKTVFNKINRKETIIFDEIDIGLSGRVAISIAKKMKEISKNSQVIVISHLPQVSACADYQYLVRKEVINDLTYSSIKLLNEDERIIEISKMLTGEVNDISLKTSKELISLFK